MSQINASMAYMLANKNFPTLDAIGDYKSHVQTGNTKYLIFYSVMTCLIIGFSLALTIMISHLELKKSQLKRRVCEALFIIESQDLEWFKNTIMEYLAEAKRVDVSVEQNANNREMMMKTGTFREGGTFRENGSRLPFSSDLSTYRCLQPNMMSS